MLQHGKCGVWNLWVDQPVGIGRLVPPPWRSSFSRLCPWRCIFETALGFVGTFQFWALVLGRSPYSVGKLPRLWGGTNANPVCSVYSFSIIVSMRCPCRPPPRFDATDSAFPLINLCISINPYLVGTPLIFGRMGVGKYARTPSMLIVAPAISSRTLLVIDGGFVTWDNLSNLLKARCRPTKRHWRVELKVD